MPKRVAVIVLVTLCIVSFASRFHEPKAVNTFKVEQIGVRM